MGATGGLAKDGDERKRNEKTRAEDAGTSSAGRKVRMCPPLPVTMVARLTELGAFPSPRRARVLWAGLDDPQARLVGLAGALDRLMEREFPAEKRPFSAHLTVARFREQASLDEEALGIDVASEPFPVEALTLYRSHLQRPAARYEALRSFPLGQRGG